MVSIGQSELKSEIQANLNFKIRNNEWMNNSILLVNL